MRRECGRGCCALKVPYVSSTWHNLGQSGYQPDFVPTPSPTSSPTMSPPSPTPAPAPAQSSAVGDPHMLNVHGERFDLTAPASHVWINISRGERAEKALLRVQANARRMGS
ncbi:unnamed protein product [Prorocentrum cordatum]|uniref:Uncharacterized protein n=1 Tax=Prorocentrum cordatum TaxID=2364126 RepID=A0ABN9RJ10_9DINO|nr:unnamed protein product [Polarella glacialis]